MSDFQKLADIVRDGEKMADPIYRRGVAATLEDMAAAEKRKAAAVVDCVRAEPTPAPKPEFAVEKVIPVDIKDKVLIYPVDHPDFKIRTGKKSPLFKAGLFEIDLGLGNRIRCGGTVTPYLLGKDIDSILGCQYVCKTKDHKELFDTADIVTPTVDGSMATMVTVRGLKAIAKKARKKEIKNRLTTIANAVPAPEKCIEKSCLASELDEDADPLFNF